VEGDATTINYVNCINPSKTSVLLMYVMVLEILGYKKVKKVVVPVFN
jgi:hypothetical protein